MKILLFGGTTEGRELFSFLSQKHDVTLSVASEYGRECALQSEKIISGKLSECEMKTVLFDGKYGAVIDATHPYATKSHAAIFDACESLHIPLLRFFRPVSKENLDGIFLFDSMTDLASALTKTNGTIFVSTGTNDLGSLVSKIDLERLFVRTLPSEESIRICKSLGLKGSRIIAMQGPFSANLNEAMFLETKSKILVTKLSGANGGEDEKIKAARALSMSIFALRRPIEKSTNLAFSKNDVALWLLEIAKNAKGTKK